MMQTPAPPLPPGLDMNLFVDQLMPIVGLVALFLGLRWVFRSPVGEALAERIRARTQRRWGGGGDDLQRVEALEAQVSHLQGQVSELAERIDFAERLLAERRERKLGAGQ